MKRYDPGTVTDEYDMVVDDHGDYVLYSDVIRDTIPRPSPEAARKAVDDVIEAHTDYLDTLRNYYSSRTVTARRKAEYEQSYAALLKLMEVE